MCFTFQRFDATEKWQNPIPQNTSCWFKLHHLVSRLLFVRTFSLERTIEDYVFLRKQNHLEDKLVAYTAWGVSITFKSLASCLSSGNSVIINLTLAEEKVIIHVWLSVHCQDSADHPQGVRSLQLTDDPQSAKQYIPEQKSVIPPAPQDHGAFVLFFLFMFCCSIFGSDRIEWLMGVFMCSCRNKFCC